MGQPKQVYVVQLFLCCFVFVSGTEIVIGRLVKVLV